jgi:hypothetical protein
MLKTGNTVKIRKGNLNSWIKKNRHRLGTVLFANPKSKLITIRWDGTKTEQRWHRSLLSRVKEAD